MPFMFKKNQRMWIVSFCVLLSDGRFGICMWPFSSLNGWFQRSLSYFNAGLEGSRKKQNHYATPFSLVAGGWSVGEGILESNVLRAIRMCSSKKYKHNFCSPFGVEWRAHIWEVLIDFYNSRRSWDFTSAAVCNPLFVLMYIIESLCWVIKAGRKEHVFEEFFFHFCLSEV